MCVCMCSLPVEQLTKDVDKWKNTLTNSIDSQNAKIAEQVCNTLSICVLYVYYRYTYPVFLLTVGITDTHVTSAVDVQCPTETKSCQTPQSRYDHSIPCNTLQWCLTAGVEEEDGDGRGDEMKLSDYVTECDALTSSMEIFTKHLIRCDIHLLCCSVYLHWLQLFAVVVKMLYHHQLIMMKT